MTSRTFQKLVWIALVVSGITFGWIIRDYFSDPIERYRRPILKSELETRFQEFTTRALGLKRLELAEYQAIEVFEQTSEARVLWDLLKLPDVVVEARVPLKIIYTVDLNEPWRVRKERDQLIVQAPTLKANDPAIDISHFEIKTKKWGLFRKNKSVKQAFQVQLMDLIRERADQSKKNVREIARTHLADLVNQWLRADIVLNAGRSEIPEDFKTIQVTFKDEAGEMSRSRLEQESSGSNPQKQAF